MRTPSVSNQGERGISYVTSAISDTPPPHGLCQPDRFLSRTRTLAPLPPSARAHSAPLGPAPTMMTSYDLVTMFSSGVVPMQPPHRPRRDRPPYRGTAPARR